MKRFLTVLLTGMMLCIFFCSAGEAETELYGYALQKLATRDGPGTTYRETGTYNVANTYIRVLSRAWDKPNGIWWVKVVIPYHGENRILWTGYKRFDPASLPLESIPVEGAAGPEASASGQDWRTAFREFISSGQYDPYIRNPDPAFDGMLLERDRAWDSFLLHDIDGNGTPELVVRTDFGIEQADVFAMNGSGISWAGRMGGENFFQLFLSYPQYPEAGLITAEGGPAMRICAYTLTGIRLQGRQVGMTTVDSEGMETTGITMNINDGTLFQLLYGTLIQGDESAILNAWISRDDLMNRNAWNEFFQ